jgi:hypothetical protein
MKTHFYSLQIHKWKWRLPVGLPLIGQLQKSTMFYLFIMALFFKLEWKMKKVLTPN